jgi:serine/threonine protein kinase
MMPDRLAEVERLFHSALARDVGQRTAFLRDACAGDEELRREVEGLLAQSASGDFMAAPAIAGTDLLGMHGASVFAGRRIGAYQIQTLLGAGGMGEVYRARDTKLGRDVAIKILPSEFTSHTDRLARFQREARVLASLNHPHIGAIYGIEDAPCEAGAHVHALVLELVEGDTLAERLRRGPVPVAEALTIARQVVDALDAAHEKGIVHRDLKPANIKITPAGVVKVLDFGLAKLEAKSGEGVEGVSESPTITVNDTREGLIVGNRGVHEPRAGARPGCRQAHGHLGLRMRALRNADWSPSVSGRRS